MGDGIDHKSMWDELTISTFVTSPFDNWVRMNERVLLIELIIFRWMGWMNIG